MPQSKVTADALLNIVRQVSDELHLHHAASIPTALDSSLERDIGFDSLSRVELFLRIERAFGISLPEQLLTTAETPRDLLRAALMAHNLPAREIESVISAHPPREGREGFPTKAETLLQVLDWHVDRHPVQPHILLQQEDGHEQTITFLALKKEAQIIASGLLSRDLQPGQSVALMLPTGREYFMGFFGILLAGGIPVPIYPPARLSQIEDHMRRHAGILTNALATILITVAEARRVGQLLKSQVASLRSVCTMEEITRSSGELPVIMARPGDIALLQYTSGSTGNPKGVVLTHANLLANIRAMGRAARTSSADVFVSWLPLYHDMGLIGAWLGSLYHGMILSVMSPLSFLARPERWLWNIHRHRGTLSGAPNFAYELCLRKIDDQALEGLDLSSWRAAFNGAEPVNANTMLKFQEKFGRYGLRREAIMPVYGLAETSLGLTFPPLGRGLLIDRIQRGPFTRSGQAIPANPGDQGALSFVACGQPLSGHEIRIVDETGREVADRQEGRLEFRGPSSTSGYYRNPDDTRKLFRGEWLDSGDYGYVAEGDVYITGRAKDVIQRAGRNIYPYELEQAVGEIAGIRRGCVAVFGSHDPQSGTERLIIMAETRETDAATQATLRRNINSVAVDILGMPPDDIVLAPPHTVLKTSSGKIRRTASRSLYESGNLGRETPRIWLQFARLIWAAGGPQARRYTRACFQVLYAGYTWFLFGLLMLIALLVSPFLPKTLAWAFGRRLARTLIWLSGTSFTVTGLELLPDRPCVLVANHASYLDGFVLMAALPRRFTFVVKRELQGSALAHLYLKAIGAQFVERSDYRRGHMDAGKLVQAIRQGHSPVFFAEGTFRRMPGLLPFRMGAFYAAAESGAPIIPAAIRGTRSILRDGQWFPRHGSVAITLCPPIIPDGSDWTDAVKLRDATRQEILRLCGEPDLGQENALSVPLSAQGPS